MVWFLPVTRLIEGRGNKRAGGGFYYFLNLPSLPNTLIWQEEKNPPSSRGSEDEGKKHEKWPLWSYPTPHLEPPLLQTEARTPPHLKSAWSLGKEMALGEEHRAGTWRFHSPVHLASNNRINLVHFIPGENCHGEKEEPPTITVPNVWLTQTLLRRSYLDKI